MRWNEITGAGGGGGVEALSGLEGSTGTGAGTGSDVFDEEGEKVPRAECTEDEDGAG